MAGLGDINVGIFKGIEAARTSVGGHYLHPGTYDVDLQCISIGTTQKNVNFVAIDFLIVRTSNPENHPVGSTAIYFCGADREHFLGNVKVVAAAILANGNRVGASFDMSVITEEVMDGLCANGGAAVVGQRLRVQVSHVLAKDGCTYARHLWSPGAAIALLRTNRRRPDFPIFGRPARRWAAP